MNIPEYVDEMEELERTLHSVQLADSFWRGVSKEENSKEENSDTHTLNSVTIEERSKKPKFSDEKTLKASNYELEMVDRINSLCGTNLKLNSTKEDQIHVGDTNLIEFKNDTKINKYGNVFIELYTRRDKNVPVFKFTSPLSLDTTTTFLSKEKGLVEKQKAEWLCIGDTEKSFLVHADTLRTCIMSEEENMKLKFVISQVGGQSVCTSIGLIIPEKTLEKYIAISGPEAPGAIITKNGIMGTREISERVGEKECNELTNKLSEKFNNFEEMHLLPAVLNKICTEKIKSDIYTYNYTKDIKETGEKFEKELNEDKFAKLEKQPKENVELIQKNIFVTKDEVKKYQNTFSF